MAPSSRFALSLKPKVAYLVLNFCAGWRKQTTLPSLAYAGIPYQVLGERAGALALMMAWRRSALARSSSVNPLDALPLVLWADFCVSFIAGSFPRVLMGTILMLGAAR